MKASIIYENDNFAIIDKAPGILSEGKPDAVLEQFAAYLKKTYPNKKQLHAGLPHRLDKPVGGLLVCTKKKSLLSEWSGTKHSPWKKYYLAHVQGLYKGPKFLTHYHAKSAHSLKAQISASPKPGYKAIHLRVKTKASYSTHSLLEVELLTGKYHQIRAQLAFAGYPILGDTLYNGEDSVPKKIELICYKLELTMQNNQPPLTFLSRSSLSEIRKTPDG